MRGAVSLAAALAVPLTVSGRPQIIFITFALILVTLVGQGLSLPFVIRNDLDAGAWGYGAVLSAAGAGAVFASLIVSQRGPPRRYLTFAYGVYAGAGASATESGSGTPAIS